MTTGYDQNGNRGNAAHGFQAQAEQVSRRLGESAQTVWLAGLGALGRVQSEGSKLFDSLVREGAAYERSGQRSGQRRRIARGSGNPVRAGARYRGAWLGPAGQGVR